MAQDDQAPQPVAPSAPAPVAEPVHVEPAPVAPAEAPVAAVEPKPTEVVEAKPLVAADEPTLLELVGKEEPKAAEAKPAEKAAEVKPAEKPAEAKPAEKPAEVKAAEVPAEPLVYTKFELPDGITLKDEELAKATTILGKHRVPQEEVQALVTQHTEALRTYAQHVAQAQQQTFADTRKEWRTQIKADDLLGGSGHQTAMSAVARARDLFVPEAEMKAFNDFCRVTGAGDHPVFNRLLFRVAQRFDEPGPAPAPTNPAPNGGKAPGGRRRVLYDHPSSATNRGN